MSLQTSSSGTAAPSRDFPPAQPGTRQTVYQDLIANRFTAAREGVCLWSTDNIIREMVESGRYQDAVCALDRSLHPQNVSLHNVQMAKRRSTLQWKGARR